MGRDCRLKQEKVHAAYDAWADSDGIQQHKPGFGNAGRQKSGNEKGYGWIQAVQECPQGEPDGRVIKPEKMDRQGEADPVRKGQENASGRLVSRFFFVFGNTYVTVLWLPVGEMMCAASGSQYEKYTYSRNS